MNDIVSNIESIRKEKGYKQEVFAEMLGVTQGTYSGYLTRNKDLKYQQLLDFANKLDVSIIDIITYPVKYVPETDKCSECRDKDKIIRNLNNYIEVLEKKLKIK